MSQIPDSLRYTKEHEWVAQTSSDSVVRVGITDFAQSALGDIVYVQLPKVGDAVTAQKVCGEVESTKSVSEIFSPVTGAISAINSDLVAKKKHNLSLVPNTGSFGIYGKNILVYYNRKSPFF